VSHLNTFDRLPPCIFAGATWLRIRGIAYGPYAQTSYDDLVEPAQVKVKLRVPVNGQGWNKDIAQRQHEAGANFRGAKLSSFRPLHMPTADFSSHHPNYSPLSLSFSIGIHMLLLRDLEVLVSTKNL
jgi:hypothetical protein